ncbi:cell wall-associated NlpC family hydrolase [Xanthobacter flavus]|uniref:Cell wall-associated NlpC family hydrolase n=1 Tax=Xanthobacter flavus TaxID=281 RepID=A0A9W6CPQ3_XANFL|nr:NlpC/P60 family protein [Xanthobacter flavus]MDR6334485.1 cell wall-associated NlpC family hydrolase [Xanthobacter flavus]GLI23495.1 tail assembly protein [Xanthobacter flavus]
MPSLTVCHPAPDGWSTPYVGIPFVDGGRDRAGCDCWGLVHLVYREVIGINLPTYGEISAHDVARVTERIREDSAGAPWLPVTGAPRPFDVLVMRGKPLHVGVMVDAAHVLHVEAATSAVIVPVSRAPQVRWRREGTFRHEALA